MMLMLFGAHVSAAYKLVAKAATVFGFTAYFS